MVKQGCSVKKAITAPILEKET